MLKNFARTLTACVEVSSTPSATFSAILGWREDSRYSRFKETMGVCGGGIMIVTGLFCMLFLILPNNWFAALIATEHRTDFFMQLL